MRHPKLRNRESLAHPPVHEGLFAEPGKLALGLVARGCNFETHPSLRRMEEGNVSGEDQTHIASFKSRRN
jgi:hypothetical protein